MNPSAPAADGPPISLETALDPLQAAFNARRTSRRVIALVSPT